ncbi:hypothetical protein EXS54_00820 [Patescibacteria group bacterium]|nr:hypothetical protein [Patescibacteria group bacterium]
MTTPEKPEPPFVYERERDALMKEYGFSGPEAEVILGPDDGEVPDRLETFRLIAERVHGVYVANGSTSRDEVHEPVRRATFIRSWMEQNPRLREPENDKEREAANDREESVWIGLTGDSVLSAWKSGPKGYVQALETTMAHLAFIDERIAAKRLIRERGVDRDDVDWFDGE